MINEKTDNAVYCMRCNSRMIDTSNEFQDYCDEVHAHFYKCPNCGCIEQAFEPYDEEKENYPYWNENEEDSIPDCSHGYDGFCPICGSHIVWGADFMRSEILCDVENEDDDSLASSVHCPHCGTSIDVIEAKPSEWPKYPYYKLSREEIIARLNEGYMFKGEPYGWKYNVMATKVEDNSIYVNLLNKDDEVEKTEIWALDAFIMGWQNNNRQFI